MFRTKLHEFADKAYTLKRKHMNTHMFGTAVFVVSFFCNYIANLYGLNGEMKDSSTD